MGVHRTPAQRNPRPRGRPKHDRIRAMRFALWAQHVPLQLLTIKQISGLLDLNKSAAAKWRRDLLQALSPVEIDGVPTFITPDPRIRPEPRELPPANTGGNRPGLNQGKD